ncbi:nucleotidyltransferase domain-containing protein [Bacillus tianshenii]|uniref:nucleotidyltransferase domain-containing protein n=1 Tax=Sutcliffiella tianshenii TaxID=1463404 RepID=UPI001CD3C355|nr:nucleotidyltransferase domain-containing protein [Bacillus tianshenii]MCA1321177.1 nucleotidyltransferase domain-containing protein [Bacillus tianshenii]
MKETILSFLKKLEKEHEVTILYACEAGSRAYGVETEKSDYDIRFIYISPLRRYLSINPVEDTIDYKQGEWDIQGWDIQKALRLAQKSNPSLYEWTLSPIVYVQEEHLTDMLYNISQSEFSKRTLLAHYVNMTKRNLSAFEEKGHYSYLYQAFRSSLMTENLTRDGAPATILLQELIAGSTRFSEDDLKHVLELKYGEADDSFSLLLGKITACIAEAQKQESRLPHTKPDINEIQEWFYCQFGI